jgi:spermidine synthase
VAWTELATASLNGSELALYRDDGDGAYMIRVNGLELMNSRWHQSEDELGALVGRAEGRHPNPRVLVGGLGLGYTLAALVRALGGARWITVAEMSADIITWYEHWLEPGLFAERPRNVRFVAADVAALLLGKGDYDVILLDIDNGPRALSVAGNEHLYSDEGLCAVKSSLADGGLLLLWSSFEAPELVARAEAAGFTAYCHPVALPGRSDLFHYIYEFSKPLGTVHCGRSHAADGPSPLSGWP